MTTITIEFDDLKKRAYQLQEGTDEYLKAGGELIISIKHPDFGEWFVHTKVDEM